MSASDDFALAGDPGPEPAAQLVPIYFFDSASYQFPEGAMHVMQYADGNYTYAKVRPGAPPLRTLYPHVHNITVKAGRLAAHYAQFCDFEQFNLSFYRPEADRDWTETRLASGLRAVWYCSRANLHALRTSLGPVLWAHPAVRFWIPTLDGRFWDAAALSWDIAHNWGMYIPASRLFGNQGRDSEQSGGPWDTSLLYDAWDWDPGK